MVRRLLKVDLARSLGVSASLVSRYAARGMPAHNVELARAWCDANLVPGLRKGVRRDDRLPPAMAAAARRELLLAGADLAELLEAAGERIAASLAYELGVDVERAALGVSAVAVALDAHLEANGFAADLWDVRGPRVGDPEVRARITARVAELESRLIEPTAGDSGPSPAEA